MQLKLAAPKGECFAFFFDDVHLLVISWQRDQHKELYLLHDVDGDVLTIDYPGDLYRDRVWDAVGEIFFVTMENEEYQEQAVKYVLGAYFELLAGDACAVYYRRDAKTEEHEPDRAAGYPANELLILKVSGDVGGRQLDIPDEAEYRVLAEQFRDRYGAFLEINE